MDRFFCGSGNCPREECRNLFWSRRVRLIAALIEEHGLKRFFTLTLDPAMIEGDPWKYIPVPWYKLRKRISRRYSEFKYVAVLEKHKNRDCPHIHGFTNIWMEKQMWTSLWQKSGGGVITWVSRVKDESPSAYVAKELNAAKYVGKENLIEGYKQKSGGRTLWRSVGLKAKFELTKSEEWSILKEWVYDDEGELNDFFAKKGVWSGREQKQKRKNVEAACRPLSESCFETSLQDMEAEESKNEPG